MSCSTFFIAGTDTGVGKTRVTTGLLVAARAEGLRVAGMKPVASGADRRDGRLVSDDALRIAAASGEPICYEDLNPYCLLEAISPHIAANRADIKVDIDKIVEIARRLRSNRDLLLIEGAGGWYTPISEHLSLAELARALEAPVVLVVALKLGCLNHARLTVEAIARSGCRIVGWIANRIDPDFEACEENLATLKHLLGAAPLGVLPYTIDTAGDAHQLRGALLHLRAARERKIT